MVPGGEGESGGSIAPYTAPENSGGAITIGAIIGWAIEKPPYMGIPIDTA